MIKQSSIQSNIKRNILIYILLITFGITFTLNYFQLKQIEIKKGELEKSYPNEFDINKSMDSKSYWSILEYMEDKEYINIKKVVKDTESKGDLHIDAEFTGNLELFEAFLESLKKNKNFKKIESIKLKKQKDLFLGELSMDFSI